MPLRLAPRVSDGWVLKTLGNGNVEAQFLGWGPALQGMLLRQARSCPRIDPLGPGQSLPMTWEPGPLGQGLWAGTVCDRGLFRPGG